MKTEVNVKIERNGVGFWYQGSKSTWRIWLVGASGRKLLADMLNLKRNSYARWYESDTYAGVGFKTLADAKKWFTKNMYTRHPEFVGDERCDICESGVTCPPNCPLREKGF